MMLSWASALLSFGVCCAFHVLLFCSNESVQLVSGQPLPLPALNYSYHALQPFYSEAQLRLHHLKHMQAYTDKLNDALSKLRQRSESEKALVKKGVDYLLRHLDEVPEDYRNQIRNQGGGYVNHHLFFNCLVPNLPAAHALTQADGDALRLALPRPSGELALLIDSHFGSFEEFIRKFTSSALALFGSGWTWLLVDERTRALSIANSANQDLPISANGHLSALLLVDVWEHSYYKDYENRRAEYLEKIWYIINWTYVQDGYQQWTVAHSQSAHTYSKSDL